MEKNEVKAMVKEGESEELREGPGRKKERLVLIVVYALFFSD